MLGRPLIDRRNQMKTRALFCLAALLMSQCDTDNPTGTHTEVKTDDTLVVITDPPIEDTIPNVRATFSLTAVTEDTTVAASDSVLLKVLAQDTAGVITNFLWDFNGDGSWDDTTETDSVYHSYPQPGTFDVTVAAVDSLGRDTVVAFHVWAGTRVSTAQYDVNTIWTKANSPFFVRQNLVIPAGTKLTIEAGVKVVLADSMNLVVLGILEAIGTQTDSIIFTTEKTKPDTLNWGSVYLGNSTSVVRYCVFEHGGSWEIDTSNIVPAAAEYGALKIYESNPSVSHSSFRKNANGIRVANSSSVIDRCLIVDSYGAGIFGQSSATVQNCVIARNQRGLTGCFGLITHNDIVNNRDRGVSSEDQDGQITYNNIVGNGTFGVVTYDDTWAVKNNNIHGNQEYQFSYRGNANTPVNVSGNYWGVATAREAGSLIVSDYGAKVTHEPIAATAIADAGPQGGVEVSW